MRIVLLILLILINTFSLPLQAMSMHTMPTNIPCDMQDMPCHSENEISDMSEMQHDNLQHSANQNSNYDCQDMDHCNDCNISCLSSFINDHHKLQLSMHKQSNSLRYELSAFPKQYPDNLYRPPLIS